MSNFDNKTQINAAAAAAAAAEDAAAAAAEDAAAAAKNEQLKTAKIHAALRNSSFVSSLGVSNGMQPEEIEKRAALALGL